MDQKQKTGSFETFRKDQKYSRVKIGALDTSLNETNIDNSHARNESPGTNYHIRCPTHTADQIYKCEICSKLRQVCPYRSVSKEKKITYTKEKHQKGIEVVNQNSSKYKVITQTKTINNHRLSLDTKKEDKRFQTPQFTGHFKDLGVKFADSLPYIKSLDGTDRTNNYKDPVKIIEVPQQSKYTQSHNSTYITHQAARRPDIRIINRPRSELKINYIGNPSNIQEIQTETKRYHIPVENHRKKIFTNEYKNQSQFVHTVHTQPTFSTYTPPPSQRKAIHVFQEFVYVPVIRNIIVPEIVVNPETRSFDNSHSKQYNLYQESNSRSGGPQYSPVKSNVSDFYNQRGVITPENFKKLAQSLIR